jgi:hypothetical protein
VLLLEIDARENFCICAVNFEIDTLRSIYLSNIEKCARTTAGIGIINESGITKIKISLDIYT